MNPLSATILAKVLTCRRFGNGDPSPKALHLHSSFLPLRMTDEAITFDERLISRYRIPHATFPKGKAFFMQKLQRAKGLKSDRNLLKIWRKKAFKNHLKTDVEKLTYRRQICGQNLIKV